MRGKTISIDTRDETPEEISAKVLGELMFLKEGPYQLEVKKKTRTLKQNSALHLLMTHIAKELNDIGQTFRYTGIKGMEMEAPWTPTLVKEFIVRPVMTALTGKTSTTKLTTTEIDQVFVPINQAFSDKGIELHFPDKMSQYLTQI